MAALVNNSLKKMVGEIRSNYSLDINVMVYFKPGEYEKDVYSVSDTGDSEKKSEFSRQEWNL